MKREIRKELLRIKKEIEKEQVSYGEINYLQCFKKEIMELGDIVLAQWAGITEAEWEKGELNNEKYEVGREVILSNVTDDEELNEFTSQYGTRVVITSIEDDNFWGVVMKDKVNVPYHMEYRDIEEFTPVEYPNIQNNLGEFTDVEQCEYCGEFFAEEDLTNKTCKNCQRAIEEHE